MPRNRDPLVRDWSREARQEPSVAEDIVWKALRGLALGFKFRREHPLGPYRLDFFCAEALLAVEMDGEQHDPKRDAERDAAIARHGIVTLRIPNRQFFLIDPSPYRDELAEIVRLCEERTGRKAFPE